MPSPPQPPPRRAAPRVAPRPSLAGKLLVALLKLLWAAFVIATPLCGAWLASSLAAYANGPVWLAALTGLLLFPLLPLGWDLFSERRRKQRKDTRPRILTLWDRLILRTLAVNLLFLGVLLATHPQRAFTALSTRGDWMLDGRQDPTAAAIRARLFRAADHLEWLYLAVRDNPFREPEEDRKDTPDPAPTAQPAPDPLPQPTASANPAPAPDPAPQPAPVATAEPSPEPRADPAPAPAARAWPFPHALHPAIERMPEGSEQSIEAVAAYVKSAEPEPVLRIKALHDYVADRIAYDAVAYATRTFPPQTAQAVFASKKAVCAGYAKLFAALGKAMGEDVVYVVGQARTQGMRNDGESHAWNAVRIDGRYHLVDVTWDSGSVDGTSFKKGYRSDYFMTPPEAFGVDHFPDNARWQLRDPPMTRGDFMRQPMLSPSFYAQGFGLVAPTRSQTTVQGEITIELQNPRGLYTLADFVQLAEAGGGGSSRTRCDAGGAQGEDRRATRIRCRFSAPGSYAVRLFSGPEQYGQYDYIGQLEVNNGS